MDFSIKDKVGISVAMGAPVEDLLAKLTHIGPTLDAVFQSVCEGEREQYVLMTMYCLVTVVAGSKDEPSKAISRFAENIPGVAKLLVDLLKARDDP